MPNELPPAPTSVIDATGRPRFGTYAGTIDTVDLRPLAGPLGRLRRHKTWQFVLIATDEVMVSVLAIDLTYAANAFVFVHDRRGHRLLFDTSYLGLPGLSAAIGARPYEGAASRFDRGASVRFEHRDGGFDLVVRAGELALDARLEGSAPPLTVIAPVPGGVVNVTQKVGGLRTTGTLRVGERSFALDGGFAGLDWTQGLLARETSWRWCFALGVAEDGTPVTINLCEGFNAGEDAIWAGQTLQPLPPVRFRFDPADVLAPWHIVAGDALDLSDGRLTRGLATVNLTVVPTACHRESRNLGVAKSRFVQAAGEASGTAVVGGRTLRLDRVAAVVEDQFVRW